MRLGLVGLLAGALTASSCDDGTYSKFYNSGDRYCEMKIYPVEVDGNRCEGIVHQDCSSGSFIELFSGFNRKIMLGIKPNAKEGEYWVSQKENSSHYWIVTPEGKVRDIGQSSGDYGLGIIQLEEEAREWRLKIFGLMQKCEGMLEEKYGRDF